ncbi:MEDS domain-containing protein [Mycobacterium sp.]|uniref:MEDS domain-containing protein n=1 Tax=Mycobacterium sp. TaxID=1785 RepID=UPI003C747C54
MSEHDSIVDTGRTRSPHDHVVHIYTDDAHLVTELASFITQGLSLDESIVIVATEQHRAALAKVLADDSKLGAETLVMVDAADMLRKFMIDGAPDPGLFETVIGGILDAAARGGRPVRVFGEMVAVLWQQGNVTGALALEGLWNDLAAMRRFFLMCAYPSSSFDDGSLHAMNSVCQLHSKLVLLGDPIHMTDARFTEQDRVASKLFLPVAEAVPTARHFVIDTLAACNLSHVADDAALIVSELAANAVVHANTAFRVVVSSASAGVVRLTVEDATRSQPVLRRAGRHDSGGRGIALIAEITREWGCNLSPGGKTVWADIPV